MKRFRDLSIKGKLTAVSLLTGATTLLLVGTASAIYAAGGNRSALARQLSTQAEIIGFNSAPALIFRDERAARETLAALRAEPQIVFAGIYTKDGTAFATYVRGGKGRPVPDPQGGLETGLRFRSDHLELVRTIGEADRPLGKVYLRADLAELRRRVVAQVGITGAVLAVSILISLALASNLQKKTISGPILDLAKTARTIAFEKNYGVRAAARSRDELGLLVQAFNEMLDQVQRRDVELRAVNQKLSQRTEELARKNEEVEAFVYIVSHDLRSPLVNLQGFSQELARSCEALTERLKKTPLAPESEAPVREILEREIPASLRFISASTTKFERLITALLQLSRSGRREFRLEPLDMNALTSITLDSLRLNIEKSGAEVVVETLPPAFGDTTAVGQVLSNLIVNALNYLQPGRPGRIEIGGRRNGSRSAYWVRDNGVGIPQAVQKKLFQVFQRFHPNLAPGEGMGLATVKRIVERHGGKIWAESTEGVGTTFHFNLPGEPSGQGGNA